jgi:hypothetical protein
MIATRAIFDSRQDSFGRRNVDSFKANGLAKRSAHTFEAGFDHVVCILAIYFNVQSGTK